MSGTPLTLNLYDEDDNILKTLRRADVPWGLLKKALRLMRDLDVNNLTEQNLDDIANLVVVVFGVNKVTIEELDAYAYTSDMISTIAQIVNKAEGLMANPPIPGPKPQE